ncbi:MAG: type I glyceraldehyde-3-phosphate dehydrogenase [Candidatus Buchananbacteria bacterium RBG_13_39_9]|uniref:Type I glyceraldehyde-3-phosphate dehydrogenase n=1 Tax=Candidatus Buchananbacteria bacterium RBG_13_39_9 TaxID=1797531 RepID=A0A1G1XPL9_9BACT|nr:MAG: type I glyceraldehyde-3-phosphate dehydrogenase [Candidatus Buchananbacteria bacterium RBG_13_39_9]
MLKVAINGFGRIGRQVYKAAIDRKAKLNIVAVNDLTDTATLDYLLRYDSVYGRWDKHRVTHTKDALVVDGKRVLVFAEKDPSKLPWKKLGIDVVVESTGFFTEKEGAALHLQAGAKKVVISAPTKSADVGTYVIGANDKKLKKSEKIISNASCTTNCTSPVMSVLLNKFGIKKAMLTTVHAYTATQKLVDSPDAKDPRRGRAAAANMVPSTTGAANAVIQTLPKLKNIFDGLSIRVPVITGSITDVTAVLNKKVTVEDVNNAFIEASKNPLYKGIIGVTKDPIVSSDIIGTTFSAIVDLGLTKVVGGDLVKVMAWYDNEWGYSCRLVEMVEKMG